MGKNSKRSNFYKNENFTKRITPQCSPMIILYVVNFCPHKIKTPCIYVRLFQACKLQKKIGIQLSAPFWIRPNFSFWNDLIWRNQSCFSGLNLVKSAKKRKKGFLSLKKNVKNDDRFFRNPNLDVPCDSKLDFLTEEFFQKSLSLLKNLFYFL